MSRPLDLLVFACECCGETKLVPEMITRLENLYEKLGADPPRVAAGYRCPARVQQTPELNGGPHAEGKAVSFETSSQYRRHKILKAVLECFDEVWIYPARVTVIAPVNHPPCVITVL